uniref:Glycosyltransferase family 1 protein n=1 Tax=Desulfacinum infernum TaxID=35837 RepID=A0A832A8Q6_9BACT
MLRIPQPLTPPSICLVAPFAPPYGGMAVQAQQWVDQLTAHGFLVVPVRANRRPSDVSLWSQLPGVRTGVNLARFLRDLVSAFHCTDVVTIFSAFFNYFFWVTFPALLVARAQKKPVILNVRGGAAEAFFHRYGTILRPMMRWVSAVIAPSGFLAQAVERAFGVKALIVPTMVDVDRFPFRIRDFGRARLLAARNLESLYGLDVVLESFARVQKKIPHARLTLVGDGSLRLFLERLAVRLGVASSVQFCGAVPHVEMPAVYDRHDILVNASRVDNLPNVILEAFACGLPVVSTRAGGIPFLVDHGQTGLLVDVDDCDGLARGVLHLLESAESARAMVYKARFEAEKHAPKRVINRFLEVVSFVLSERSR